ncbi:MAG TPA: M23 family metallopeptidase [Pantanalinema sp.]
MAGKVLPWLVVMALLAGCDDGPTVPQINPLPGARLTSDFGQRARDPVTGKALVDGHHDGYDLAAPMGSPIRAAKAGKVTFAGVRGGYGNAVILAHPGGWTTVYGHASRLAVKVGQAIDAGQVIAYVGSTGHSTGPHLHYELRRDGLAVDPKLAVAAALQPAVRPAKAAAKQAPASKGKLALRTKPMVKKATPTRARVARAIARRRS